MPASGELACESQEGKNYGMLLSNMSPRNQFGVIYLRIFLKDLERETGNNHLYIEINQSLMVKLLEV